MPWKAAHGVQHCLAYVADLTFITVKVRQVFQQLVSVTHKNVNDWPCLVWVGNKHLHAQNSEYTAPFAA